MSYRLQCIGCAKFMASSLSKLVNSLAERIHKIKCKYGQNAEKVKIVELNIRIVTAFLNKQSF